MRLQECFPYQVCVNLANREDRRRVVWQRFAEAGLVVDRQPGISKGWVRDCRGFMNPSRYACSLAKRLAIRRGKLVGAPAVLLFEDDVVLAPDLHERLAAIDLPEDWEIFFLGCKHLERPEVVAPGLVRVTKASDHHAMAVRSDHFDKVMRGIAGYRKGSPPSIRYSDLKLSERFREMRCYAAYPNLAWQSVTVSDNTLGHNTSYDKKGAQLSNLHAVCGLDNEMAECLRLHSRTDEIKILNPDPVRIEGECHVPTYQDCSMVTAALVTQSSRQSMLVESIEDFMKQDYSPRQLLFIVDEMDFGFRLHRSYPWSKVVITTPGKTLGELRNLGIDHSDGSYVIHWDDDDRHRSDRIRIQVTPLLQDPEVVATYLRRQVIELRDTVVSRNSPSGIMGTILHRRNVEARYPHWCKGEDTEFKARVGDYRSLIIDNEPDLYIRRFHGENTWDESHFLRLIRNESSSVSLDTWRRISKEIMALPRQSDFKTLFPKICYLNRGRDEAERHEIEYQFALRDMIPERVPIPDTSAENSSRWCKLPLGRARSIAMRQAIRQASQVRSPSIMIASDSFEFRVEFRDWIERAELPPDWDVLILGASHSTAPNPRSLLCLQVTSLCDVWMLAVREKAYRVLRRALRECRLLSDPVSAAVSKIAPSCVVVAIHPPVVWPTRLPSPEMLHGKPLWHRIDTPILGTGVIGDSAMIMFKDLEERKTEVLQAVDLEGSIQPQKTLVDTECESICVGAHLLDKQSGTPPAPSDNHFRKIQQ